MWHAASGHVSCGTGSGTLSVDALDASSLISFNVDHDQTSQALGCVVDTSVRWSVTGAIGVEPVSVAGGFPALVLPEVGERLMIASGAREGTRSGHL